MKESDLLNLLIPLIPIIGTVITLIITVTVIFKNPIIPFQYLLKKFRTKIKK